MPTACSLVREARASSSARLLDRTLYTLSYATFRIIAETDEARTRRANAEFDDALAGLKPGVATLRERAPTVDARVDRLARDLDDLAAGLAKVRDLVVAHRSTEALELFRRDVDPVMGNQIQETRKLALDIQNYVSKASDDLTGQTNATRTRLMVVSGLVLGLAAVAGVAAEVKELDAQTARATDEIGQRIAAVQSATGETVSAITARIREIDSVTVAGAAAVEEQGVATQEIVRNVSQAATGTAGVAGAAEETGAAATQVVASATELSRQSEHLGAEVARFLATVRAA